MLPIFWSVVFAGKSRLYFYFCIVVLNHICQLDSLGLTPEKKQHCLSIMKIHLPEGG